MRPVTREGRAAILLGFSLFCASAILQAQTRPQSAGANSGTTSTNPGPATASPSGTTSLSLSGKASLPIKPYSIHVRASVVGIGKDAKPGEVPKIPGVSASLPESPESRRGFVEALDHKAKWGAEQMKFAAPGTPIQVKLIGGNIVALVQLIPFENGPNSLDVVASGQVWMMMPDGGIQYRTTVSTLSVTLAERMFFFPLGYFPDGSSPLVVEIIVDRLAR